MERLSLNLKKTYFFYTSILTALLFGHSCEDAFESKVSTHNSQGSHNTGQNCMNCHYKDGPGEDVFSIAGTIYKKDTLLVYPNTTIELYTDFYGSGRKKYSLETDAYGNFYSTRNINFSKGLYPAAIGTGAIKHMTESTTSGACNSCHGVTTDYLWAH